jgi:transposase
LKKIINYETIYINSQDAFKLLYSFIKGLKRDLDDFKNAIIYSYNNGLAECSINKIKVIKIIMYDRCGFNTLRAKVLQLEKMRKIN